MHDVRFRLRHRPGSDHDNRLVLVVDQPAEAGEVARTWGRDG